MPIRPPTRGAAGGALAALMMLPLGGVLEAQERSAWDPPRADLTLDAIFTQNFGSQSVTVSPQGRWIAVTSTTPDDSGVRLVSVSEPAAGYRTLSGGSSPDWLPDGSGVVYRAGGDLWRIGLESNAEPVRLTRDPELDERAPRVSPDGRWVAFYSTRSGSQDVWVIPVNGGAPRQVTDDAMAVDDPRFAPGWSPDGRHIAYVSNASDYWHDDLWVVGVEDGVARQLSRTLMASSTPVWSPDGSTIALMGTSKDEYWYEDLAYIYLVDPGGGGAESVSMQIHATDWLHNHTVYWAPDGSELFFPYQERGDFDLWRVSARGGVATRVSNVGGALRAYHASPDGSGFAMVRTTPTRGADVDWVSRQGGPARRLTWFATEFSDLAEPVEVSYRSWDGLYIQGFLYRAAAPGPDRPGPALVNVHGGGTNSHLHGQNLIEQYLASQGFPVLAVNYRGGSGFGRAFQDLSINDWANGQARDAAAAADFVRSQPWSNGRVGIYGYSYGGIQTMAAIARVPDAFDAAVPMAGIYDFGDAYRNADRLGKIFIRTGHGGAPEDQPEVYAVSNTLARVGQVRTPLLIMHGEEDVRAPYRQYELAVAKLEEIEADFASRSYPGEPHGFRNPANRIDMYERLVGFFNQRLR